MKSYHALFALLVATAFAAPARADVVRLRCDNDAAGVHDTIDIDFTRKSVLRVYANGNSDTYQISGITDRFIVWRGEWSKYHTDPPRLTGVEYRLDRATGLISWEYINPDGSGLGDRLNPYQGACKRVEGNVL